MCFSIFDETLFVGLEQRYRLLLFFFPKRRFQLFQYGMRPILMAAWHGHTDAVQMLINYGASVNTINKVSFNNDLQLRMFTPGDKNTSHTERARLGAIKTQAE